MQGTLIDSNHKDASDLTLRSDALSGKTEALEALIKKHYSFIYNVALRMTLDPQDAEDVTQEVVIRIITSLNSFEGKSSFRTWLYRIVCNHILNMKKRHCEYAISGFETYGKELSNMPDHSFPKEYQNSPEEVMILEEVKLGCTAGMLMCLDREQRLIYILGAIFEIDHVIGSEVLDITKDNFRQKLSRAKSQLRSFMNGQCSLVNSNNKCKCNKKTKAFIEAGMVDPKKMTYNIDYQKKINQILPAKDAEMAAELEDASVSLFQNAPFHENKGLKSRLVEIINTNSLRKSLNIL